MLSISMNTWVSFTWSRLFSGNRIRPTLLPHYSQIKMRSEPNIRLIINCLEGLFPSVPLTRISHYSLIQKHTGLRAVRSAGGCAVGRGPDLRTERRCGSSAPKPTFCSDGTLGMSQLGVLTLHLQMKAFEAGVKCAMSWLQNNSFFTCLHLCLVLETVRRRKLTGPLKEHSCVSRGAVGTGLEIFGLACFLLFRNLFGI